MNNFVLQQLTFLTEEQIWSNFALNITYLYEELPAKFWAEVGVLKWADSGLFPEVDWLRESNEVTM